MKEGRYTVQDVIDLRYLALVELFPFRTHYLRNTTSGGFNGGGINPIEKQQEYLNSVIEIDFSVCSRSSEPLGGVFGDNVYYEFWLDINYDPEVDDHPHVSILGWLAAKISEDLSKPPQERWKMLFDKEVAIQGYFDVKDKKWEFWGGVF